MTTVHPTTELFMMTAGEDMMEYQAHLDQGSLVAVEDLDIEIESKEQTVKDTEDENMFGDGYGMEEQIMQEADGVTLGNDEEMGDEQHHQHPMEDELLVDADDYHHGETVDDILDEDIQDNFEDVGQNISEHHDILQNNFSTEAEFELDDLDYVDEHSHEPQNFDDHIDENGVSANDVHAPEVGSNSADGPTLVSEVDGGDHYSSVEQPTVDATSGSLPTYSNTRDAKDYKRHGDESETPANDGLEDFNFEGDDLLVSEDEDLGDLVAPEERPSVPGPSFQGQEVITSSDANSVHRNAQITNEGSLEQAENLSQVGQTHIGSFEGHAHPIIVHYQENEISLFPPVTENESSETYFLADEGLARESLRTILQACKSVLADSIGEEEELEIKVPCLKLRVLETAIEAESTTLTQLVDIYLQLHQNDGNSEPEPLHVLLNCKPRFNSQIDYLYSVLQAGKGFRNIDTSRADPSYEGLTQDESKENSGNTSQKGEDGVGLTVTYSANEDRSGFQTPNDPRREEEEDYELDFRSPATIQRAAMGVGGQLSTVDQGTYATETLQMFEHADSTDYHEQIGHGHTLDNNTPRANVEGYESAGDELTQSITDLGNGQDDQGTNAGSPKRSGSFSSATLRGEASEDAKGAASESRMNTNSHSFDQIPVGTSQDGPYGAVDHDEIGYDEYEFEFDEGKNNGENLTEHYPLPQEDYEEHLPRYSKHQTLPEEKTSSKSSGPPTASIFDEDNENEIDYQDDDDLEPSHVEETTLATQPEPRKSLSPDSLKRQRSLEDDPKPSEIDPKRIRSN